MNIQRLRQAWLAFLGSLLAASFIFRTARANDVSRPVEVPQVDLQIAGAVQAAPAERRDGARILGYGSDGRLKTVRQGTNDLVCLADDPKKEGFHVACYHRDLEPYMARGRELRAQGVHGEANRKTRWREVDEGQLALPREPKTVYVLSGRAFDPTQHAVTEGYLRWVIYLPYATPESTGLSLSPAENGPWLMLPGTAGAHIMINPSAASQKKASHRHH